jgi:hypothetical protein
VRLGQFMDATATAKQFVTGTIESSSGTCPSAIQISTACTELDRPQSEYPLNVGKSAVPVEVPVTPRLTPEVVEDRDELPALDEGGRVEEEEEEGIGELACV